MKKRHPSILALLVAAACHTGAGGSGGENDDDTPEPTETVFPSGVPIGPAASAVIGPAGGTLDSTDGMLRVTIGAGALAEDTTIGIEPVTNTGPGGLGTSYRLSPEGTTFASPIQIEFVVDDGDLAGTIADAVTIGFQDHDGLWWAVPESDVLRELEANAISVSTTHFSDWSLLSGLQLRPPEHTLREGETIGLTVVDCEPDQVDEELMTLLSRCSIDEELPPLPGFVSEWAVDGIPGGSDGVGTITAGARPDLAVYTAPEFAVGVERHTVSAKMQRRSGEVVLLVSNITVMGAFTFQLSGVSSVENSYDACQFVTSDMSDRVDVVIGVNDAGIYDVEEFTNHTTTYTLDALPPGDPGSIRQDTPPEQFTATDGSVTTIQGSDAIGISLFGTGTIGGCTYIVDGQEISIESMSWETGIGTSFKISDLVDGSLVIAEEADWSWTVTQIQ